MGAAQDIKRYALEVGGKPFAIDSEDLEKIGSPFLSTLVDPESNFAQPEDGIYRVDADAACFAAFLFFRRFGSLPRLELGESFVLDQADFWGVREKVSSEMHKLAEERAAYEKKWHQYLQT